MKANEAPKRVYCESDGLGNIVKVHNIKWPDDEAENIEYTNTEVFFEKAEEYIYKQLNEGCIECGDIEQFIGEMKNYMKGERVYGKI